MSDYPTAFRSPIGTLSDPRDLPKDFLAQRTGWVFSAPCIFLSASLRITALPKHRNASSFFSPAPPCPPGRPPAFAKAFTEKANSSSALTPTGRPTSSKLGKIVGKNIRLTIPTSRQHENTKYQCRIRTKRKGTTSRLSVARGAGNGCVCLVDRHACGVQHRAVRNATLPGPEASTGGGRNRALGERPAGR